MNYLEKFQDIQTFIFDIDGVMTDNRVVVFEDGKLVRVMNVRDGYAMKHAILQGYRIAIITGGRSKGVEMRLRDLGIQDIYKGISNKIEAYEEFIYTYDLNPDDILYMGDDVPDYPVMRRVGLPTCPADAIPEIMEISRYVSPYVGGAGCVRDVIEKVLKLHEKWHLT